MVEDWLAGQSGQSVSSRSSLACLWVSTCSDTVALCSPSVYGSPFPLSPQRWTASFLFVANGPDIFTVPHDYSY